MFELGTTSPGHIAGRLDLAARAGWRDATQVGYYGLGMATSPDDRANYRFQEPYAEGSATFRPLWWMPIGGLLSYERYHLKSGKGSDPSIETRYTASTAPGLGDSPAFIHATVLAGIDTRPSALYTRRGGYYGIAFHRFADLDQTYTFNRMDAELIQHLPILRETWVLSFRARMETTIGDDSVVPYFLLPPAGGGRTLRAYSSWRFRDRHALLANIEWRWIPSRLALDMAVFCDTGAVTPRRADLASSIPHQLGRRRALPRAGCHDAADRDRERSRRVATRICEQRGFLIRAVRWGFVVLVHDERRRPREHRRRSSSTTTRSRTNRRRRMQRAPPSDIDLTTSLLLNLFVPLGGRPNVRAGNLNTIDEVPDSSWFTNRIYTAPVTAADVARGPNTIDGPAPGRWTVIGAKTTGAAPGFRMRDARGRACGSCRSTPRDPDAATGAIAVACRLFWALGYNQVENYLTSFRRDDLDDRRDGEDRGAAALRAPMSSSDLDACWRVRETPDGSYRAMAARALPGRILGGFPYRHASRRSQRHRAARAAPRAARAESVWRVDEPRSISRRSTRSTPSCRGRPRPRPSLPAGRRVDLRFRRPRTALF